MSGLRPKVTIAGAGVLLSLAGCSGAPSALDPRGPAAGRVEGLWWLSFWVATAVFLVVVGLLTVAVVRSRRGSEVKGEVRWGDRFIVLSGVVLPSIILISVFVVSLRDTAELARGGDDATLTIEVESHDWWWEISYPDGAVTANEIHIPVGEPVKVELPTADVIHSLWVPQLQTKTDHVTGRVNEMWLEADEPGRYRGQCAEFCGLQHAKMAFFVIAEEPEEFEAWLANEALPASAAAEASPGREVFLESTCTGCHSIRGTSADAEVGPDLTHLARRDTLFAGTLANSRAGLGRVISDPQSIKPGAAMPPTDLTAGELDALLDFMQDLD